MAAHSVEISECSISAGQYARLVARAFAADWWPAMLIAVSVLLMLAIHDVRWIIVGLMLIFLVLPMAVFFFFAWQCTKPEARHSIMSKSVLIDDEGVTLTANDTGRSTLLEWNKFGKAYIGGGKLILKLRDGRYSLLVLPCAVEQLPELRELVARHLT